MDGYEQVLTDWEALLHFLPAGWKEQGRATGALQRSREISDPEVLLRLLLMHLAQGYSLKETAVRAAESGLARVSSVAIHKRFRRSGDWLRWMAERVLQSEEEGCRLDGGQLRVRMVDASAVSEPGSTGSDWRVHYALQLKPLRCDFFELSDIHSAESLRRIPVKKGDLILGDRVYANAKGVAYVLDCGGEILVRMRQNSFRLIGANRRPFRLLTHLRRLRLGQVGEWSVSVLDESGRLLPGRVCALKRTQAAVEVERERLRKKYNKHRGTLPGPLAWEGAKYTCIFTTVSPTMLSAIEAMELYRARWQIELAFKRMKSIFDFGHLPKSDPESSKAWLLGKLLVALLAETIVVGAESLSPWGYCSIPQSPLEAGERR